MTKTYEIRVSAIDDGAAVSSLLRASYPKLMRSAYDPVLLEKALPRMTTAQPGLLESDSYYVAESAAREIIGCGGWTRERPGTNEIEENVGHIRHFGVHPDWTRCGVGKALYARCARDARDAGIAQFECYSSINGETFYAALGFKRLAEIDLHLFDSVYLPSVHMVADI